MPEESVDARPMCFVISPIGEDGTGTRQRANQVLRHIIEPAANAAGFRTSRADLIGEPGRITGQIVRHLADAAVVVADLADLNPNVMYELAIRHVLKRPFVHIREVGQRIPFDISDVRAIDVDIHDLDSAANARTTLEAMLVHIRDHPDDLVETPFTVGVELLTVRRDPPSTDEAAVQLATELVELREMIGTLRSEMRVARARDEGATAVLLERLARYSISRQPDPPIWRRFLDETQRGREGEQHPPPSPQPPS